MKTINFKETESPNLVERGVILVQLFMINILYDKKTYVLILCSIFPLLTILQLESATAKTFVDLIRPSDSLGSVFSFILMPLISLILGISAISDEKEQKTLSQFLARPVYREEFVITKWISIAIIGICITGIDALIINIGLCIQVNDFSVLFNNLDVFLVAWVYLGLWFLVYSTIFLFLGVVIDKNALGWGLGIAYFEAFFSQFIFGNIGSASAFSIINHINYVGSYFLLGDYYEYIIPNFDPEFSLLICVGLIFTSLALSVLVMRRKDFP
jgi:ABC-type transport system involved in multi-copper enzyme maturation permease subunit